MPTQGTGLSKKVFPSLISFLFFLSEVLFSRFILVFLFALRRRDFSLQKIGLNYFAN